MARPASESRMLAGIAAAAVALGVTQLIAVAFGPQADARTAIGSAIGAFFGAIIFGMVSIGLTYTRFDSDWFQVFLGAMLLLAVLFNNFIRKKVTGER